jgi:hypothetical protein
MSENFFEALGKATARQLAQKLDYDQTRASADQILNRHLRGGMARDQAPGSMPPRGAESYPGLDQEEDPNGGQMLDAEACMHLVQKCLAGLQGDERDKFMEALANMFRTDSGTGNGGSADMPAYGDTGFAAGIRNNNRGATDRRRPAQDSAIRALQSAGFARRFPDAMKISTNGMGRR